MSALGNLGQELVEAAREVIAYLSNLPVHYVEVVEQPFLGLRDLVLLSNRLDNVPVPGEQYASVLAQSRKECSPFESLVGSRLGGGQTLRVFPEPLDAERLSADRLFQSRSDRRFYGGHLVRWVGIVIR